MPTPEEIAAQEAQAAQAAVEIPKGRAAMLERYKKNNPDMQEEPDDESLYEYAGKGWNERDELEKVYNNLNSSNEIIVKAIREYPEFAKWIAMIGTGENPWWALGKILGPKADKLDDESLAKLHEGQAEYAKKIQQINEKVQKYYETVDAYCAKNGLTAENKSAIHNTISDMIDAFIDYDIDETIVDNVWKGIDYDEAQEANAGANELGIRNKVIEEMKPALKQEAPVPDSGKGAAGRGMTPKRTEAQDAPYRPISETMERVK